MQQNQAASIREVFEKMTTEELDEILDREVHSEIPDADAIRLIMRVLREREKDMPIELTPQMVAAREHYKQEIEKLTKQCRRERLIRQWAIRLAAAAAVLAVVVISILPKKAEAESLWDRFIRWTADVVEFFSPADTESRILEYAFQTDNPGLQEVYDTAVEQGITFPVVPMWLPEGAELLQCSVLESPTRERIIAQFSYNDGEIIYNIEIYDQEVAHSFDKDETQIKITEIEGTQFAIMKNNDLWAAVWEKDNVECSIAIDCQEEDLYKILKSIYVMEGI